MSKLKDELFAKIVKITEELGELPNNPVLSNHGIKADRVKYHFGTLANLHSLLKKIKKFSNFKRKQQGTTQKIFFEDETIINAYVELFKKLGHKPSFVEMRVNKFPCSASTIGRQFGNLEKFENFIKKHRPEVFSDNDKTKREMGPLRHSEEDIIADYVRVYKKVGFMPNEYMLRTNNFIMSITNIRVRFGSIQNLDAMARKSFPNEFSNVSIGSIFTQKRIAESKAISEYKRFIITTAVTGCAVHKPTYESLKTLCKKLNAKLLILVCSDPAKPKDLDDSEYIDAELTNETIIFSDTKLNNNLHIDTFKTSAKQIKPTTGVGRITKKLGSTIIASPKFFLEYFSVRNAKNKLAPCVMTTGAVTVADYNSEMYMSQRTAKIATYDHTFGAIYVEIENKELFHFRQIEIRNDEGILFFGDLKIQLNQVSKVRPEMLVMGDLHVGASDPEAVACFNHLIDKYKPRGIAIHDGLNGTSINHWIEKDFIELYKRSKARMDCLETELDLFCSTISSYAQKCEKILIVPSNHNDWLDDWIRLGKFMKDSKNALVGVEIARGLLHGANNPLKYYYEQLYKGKKMPNIIWLERNEDYFISDVQINCHGDIGTGGSRGSIMGMEKAYIASVSGHGHLAGIIRDAWRVGTLTHLQESYNNGPGPWTNTCCLVYEYGCRSLVNYISGSKGGFYAEKF